jgi:hypothetical protein
MMRWYNQCCKTPIANAQPSFKSPVVGLIHSIMDFSADPQSPEQIPRPIRARVNAKYGIPSLPKDVSRGTPAKLLGEILYFFCYGWIKNLPAPSPFFNSFDGKPIEKPLILTDLQYERLLKQRSQSKV